MPSLSSRLHPPTPPAKSARRARVVVKRCGPHRLEAAAWFAVAAAILAWGRKPEGAAAPAPPASPKSLWRRVLSGLVGVAPQDAEVEVDAIAALEPGRGREARSPVDIPARGWKDILWRTWSEFNKDRITAVAGGVSFFGLLALFPAIAAFVSLYGLFSDVHTALKQLGLLAGILPLGVLSFVGEQMIRLATGAVGGLGLAFVASLSVSLWSANAGVMALMDGLNIAYEERERRGFLRLNAVSLAFTAALLVCVLAALALVVAVPAGLALVGYGGPDPMWMLRWPLLLGMGVPMLEALYRWGPSRESARWRWVSWGGVVAALLWIAASMAFSRYVESFAHYDRIYGSLGAVVGFMMWMWMSIIVVLFGAELNAEIEHQTAVDSTTGAPRPLGQRGAKMADTLGESADAASHKPDAAKQADPRAERAGAPKVADNSEPAPV